MILLIKLISKLFSSIKSFILLLLLFVISGGVVMGIENWLNRPDLEPSYVRNPIPQNERNWCAYNLSAIDSLDKNIDFYYTYFNANKRVSFSDLSSEEINKIISNREILDTYLYIKKYKREEIKFISLLPPDYGKLANTIFYDRLFERPVSRYYLDAWELCQMWYSAVWDPKPTTTTSVFQPATTNP